jgi:hypothetical protein
MFRKVDEREHAGAITVKTNFLKISFVKENPFSCRDSIKLEEKKRVAFQKFKERSLMSGQMVFNFSVRLLLLLGSRNFSVEKFGLFQNSLWRVDIGISRRELKGCRLKRESSCWLSKKINESHSDSASWSDR